MLYHQKENGASIYQNNPSALFQGLAPTETGIPYQPLSHVDRFHLQLFISGSVVATPR